MSIQELADIEAQFSSHLQLITQASNPLPKSHRLRVAAWLKKLCSVVDNTFWRKNRNLYAEVLSLMLADGHLGSPFDKSPPETALPKLNIYEIPFKIRNQLACEKKADNKENEECINRTSVCRHRKKQSAKLESMKSMQEPFTEIEFEIETRRKRASHQEHTKDRDDLLIETLEASLKFLAKNHEDLSHLPDFRDLIRETVSVADEMGRDLREMKFSMISST